MSVRDEVKEVLGALDPLRRKLSAADENWAEIDTVGGILSVRKEAAEAELAKARDEISILLDWIMGDRDALACLQSIYNSTTASEANRAKAAAAARRRSRPT